MVQTHAVICRSSGAGQRQDQDLIRQRGRRVLRLLPAVTDVETIRIYSDLSEVG